MAGIYIHVPFCIKACTYCDFYFSTNHKQKDAFVDALIKEIESFPDELSHHTIETIYFGGGTPSVLSPDQVESILEAIRSRFPKIDLKESTMEMNPEHISEAYLCELKKIGITRVSVGIQSFDSEYLSFMNRAHSRETALSALATLQSVFPNDFTADLIYGLPNQTASKLKEDIAQLLHFAPKHVSAYALTVEEKTKLQQWVDKGEISLPNDVILSEFLDIVIAELQSVGIERYEVSNFAVPGFESKHNSAYWNHTPYFGFGPSAHSFYSDNEGKRIRSWKQKNIARYLQSSSWKDLQSIEELTEADLATEFIMVSLRQTKGLNVNFLKQKYNFEFRETQWRYLEHCASIGYAKIESEIIALTHSGLMLGEGLVSSLLAKG